MGGLSLSRSAGMAMRVRRDPAEVVGTLQGRDEWTKNQQYQGAFSFSLKWIIYYGFSLITLLIDQ